MVHYPSTSKRKGRPSLVRALVNKSKQSNYSLHYDFNEEVIDLPCQKTTIKIKACIG